MAATRNSRISPKPKRRRGCVLPVVLILIGVALVFIYRYNKDGSEVCSPTMADTLPVQHNRLSRSAIPKVNLSPKTYATFFADINDVQMEAAQANGQLFSESAETLVQKGLMQAIASCELYSVAPMTYGHPCLVSDAALLVSYIGERFKEVLSQHSSCPYSNAVPIVTSAYRSDSDVKRLRRRNRNASENSCHRYGTTMDVSYMRFMCGDSVVSHWMLTDALATALYELRYENLCYVKYERRQSCFHITVRAVDYAGTQPSESKTYKHEEPRTPAQGYVDSRLNPMDEPENYLQY